MGPGLLGHIQGWTCIHVTKALTSGFPSCSNQTVSKVWELLISSCRLGPFPRQIQAFAGKQGNDHLAHYGEGEKGLEKYYYEFLEKYYYKFLSWMTTLVVMQDDTGWCQQCLIIETGLSQRRSSQQGILQRSSCCLPQTDIRTHLPRVSTQPFTFLSNITGIGLNTHGWQRSHNTFLFILPNDFWLDPASHSNSNGFGPPPAMKTE